MDKCLTVELGVQDTHLREKKIKKREEKNIEHLIPLKRAKVELDIHQCFHHHHHTPFIRHTCTS